MTGQAGRAGRHLPWGEERIRGGQLAAPVIFNKLDLVDIPASPKAKLCRSAPNATTGSDGYRSKSGANLIVPGTSLSGITTDISGAARNPSKPDIGVWEVAQLAAAAARHCSRWGR